MATVLYGDPPKCPCCLRVFAGRREATIKSCGHSTCEDCMWICRHQGTCVFCQAPINRSTIDVPTSYQAQTASIETEQPQAASVETGQPQIPSVETELTRKSTKRVKREEINGARSARSPSLQANDQEDTPEVLNIRYRIRAMLPNFNLGRHLLTFETKLRPKLMPYNTLYPSLSPFAHNAVLVYKYKALDIYIVADLSGAIIPVAKIVWLAIEGEEARPALFDQGNIQIKFFDTANQAWKLLEGQPVLSDNGVTDGSHIRMPWDLAIGVPD